MPYLEGESLQTRLNRESKLPIPEVLRLVSEIAKGLAAAHAAGLVHRDIKPDNIWLESPGARAKLIDFGLVKSPESRLTRARDVMGTPTYMSPEQTRGEPLTEVSDIFSLGVVAYQMATGELPFQGSGIYCIMDAVNRDTPLAPGELNPEVPRPLSNLVMQMLAKDPAGRSQSACAVHESLRALFGEDIGAVRAIVPGAVNSTGPQNCANTQLPRPRGWFNWLFGR